MSLIPSEGTLRMLLGSYKYSGIMALINHGQAYNSTGARYTQGFMLLNQGPRLSFHPTLSPMLFDVIREKTISHFNIISK